MIEFLGLRAKLYSYLIYDDSEDKAKGTKLSLKENLNLKAVKTA